MPCCHLYLLLFSTMAVGIWGKMTLEPRFVEVPRPLSAVLKYGETPNRRAHLRCEVVDVMPPQKVSWFKDGVRISDNNYVRSDGEIDFQSPGGMYSIDSGGKGNTYNLLFSQFGVTEVGLYNGDYFCAVLDMNSGVIIRSDAVKVELFVIPHDRYPVCLVNGQSDHKTALFAGDPVQISCLTGPGFPPMAMAWFENNFPNALAKSVGLFDTPLLSLLNHTFVPRNNSRFVCKLHHESFDNDRKCLTENVIVYKEPEVLIYPKECGVNSDTDTVRLTCNTSILPGIKNYIWVISKRSEHSMEKLRFKLQASNRSIEVRDLRSEDNGVYTVSCTVDYGFSSRDATSILTVNIARVPVKMVPEVTSPRPHNHIVKRDISVMYSTEGWLADISEQTRTNHGHAYMSTASRWQAPVTEAPNKFNNVLVICITVAAAGVLLFVIVTVTVYVKVFREKRQYRIESQLEQYSAGRTIVYNKQFESVEMSVVSRQPSFPRSVKISAANDVPGTSPDHNEESSSQQSNTDTNDDGSQSPHPSNSDNILESGESDDLRPHGTKQGKNDRVSSADNNVELEEHVLQITSV